MPVAHCRCLELGRWSSFSFSFPLPIERKLSEDKAAEHPGHWESWCALLTHVGSGWTQSAVCQTGQRAGLERLEKIGCGSQGSLREASGQCWQTWFNFLVLLCRARGWTWSLWLHSSLGCSVRVGVGALLRLDLLVKGDPLPCPAYLVSSGSPGSGILLCLTVVLSQLIWESSPFSWAEHVPVDGFGLLTEMPMVLGSSPASLPTCCSCVYVGPTIKCCCCIPEEACKVTERLACSLAHFCAGLFLVLFPESPFFFAVSGRKRNPKCCLVL